MNKSQKSWVALSVLGVAFALAGCSGAGAQSAENEPARSSAGLEEGHEHAEGNAHGAGPEGHGPPGRFHHRDGEGGPPSPERMIARFDANKNGSLEAAEVPEPMRDHFADFDANKDGTVTKEELTARFEQKGKERFAEKDKNKDGFLDASEVGAKRWERMNVADANGDQKLTFEELRAAMESGKLKPPHDRQHRHFKGEPGDGPRGNHDGPPPPANASPSTPPAPAQ